MLVYVLLTANQGSLNNLVVFIKKSLGENINKFFFVYGEFDILLKLKAVSEAQVSAFVSALKKNQDVRSIDVYMVKDILCESNVLPKVRY